MGSDVALLRRPEAAIATWHRAIADLRLELSDGGLQEGATACEEAVQSRSGETSYGTIRRSGLIGNPRSTMAPHRVWGDHLPVPTWLYVPEISLVRDRLHRLPARRTGLQVLSDVGVLAASALEERHISAGTMTDVLGLPEERVDPLPEFSRHS